MLSQAGSCDRRLLVAVCSRSSSSCVATASCPVTCPAACSSGLRCTPLPGDPRQLPPTILSREAVTAHGLDVTLFERLVGRGLEPLLLDTQYRMHPAISAWPRWG